MGQVGKHALIYGLGIVLSRAVSFIMLPIYTRYLTPSDYGVMELIGMTLDVISMIAGAQIALGILRYYHKAQHVVEKQAVPKERVRLDKEAHTDERQVSDTLRKEEIEVDDARGAR